MTVLACELEVCAVLLVAWQAFLITTDKRA
jgi:hypothetical protein